MGRFNLLEEPWIAVAEGDSGRKKEVSMLELFRNAQHYRKLAGEMETQNFATLRLLLSVLQTVFSRYDFDGNVLPGIILDENGIQTEPLDTDETDDVKDFSESVYECWKRMYDSGKFPNILLTYLEKWHDHFYLFDDEHPFYQVTKQEMDELLKKSKKGKPTTIYGRNLNRTISESENKAALFSPIADKKIEKRSIKDVLSASEFVRWLITFQGYSGLADKVSLTGPNQRPSKGWLFDIGGIYIQGNNLFETLLLNYIPVLPGSKEYCGRIQKPCWEEKGLTVVNRLCKGESIDNLAELYTNWSRAVYIDPETDVSKPIQINIIKLPEIDHSEHSIEPMTIWASYKSGRDKPSGFSPRKHKPSQSLWRSFGMIAGNSFAKETTRQPSVIDHYQERLVSITNNRWVDLNGISMQDDGNATSWLPVDEIYDSFHVNSVVVSDKDADGWVKRITDAVEKTNFVASVIYREYLKGICSIRGLDLEKDSWVKGFVNNETSLLYSVIDSEFKEWLSSLKPTDNKEESIRSWYGSLRKLVLHQGELLFENSTARDLIGKKTEESGFDNIATIYWKFVNSVTRTLGKGGQKVEQ